MINKFSTTRVSWEAGRPVEVNGICGWLELIFLKFGWAETSYFFWNRHTIGVGLQCELRRFLIFPNIAWWQLVAKRVLKINPFIWVAFGREWGNGIIHQWSWWGWNFSHSPLRAAFNLEADWILSCQADRSQAKETTFLFQFRVLWGTHPGKLI